MDALGIEFSAKNIDIYEMIRQILPTQRDPKTNHCALSISTKSVSGSIVPALVYPYRSENRCPKNQMVGLMLNSIVYIMGSKSKSKNLMIRLNFTLNRNSSSNVFKVVVAWQRFTMWTVFTCDTFLSLPFFLSVNYYVSRISIRLSRVSTGSLCACASHKKWCGYEQHGMNKFVCSFRNCYEKGFGLA